jgi:putative heme-binding domain-containing protein
LLKHTEDAGDHNLPLMYWYALEPLAGTDMTEAIDLASGSKLTPLLEFTVRRISSTGSPKALATLVTALKKVSDEAHQRIILQGLQAGLKGRRQVPMPAGWADIAARLAKSADPDIRSLLSALAVTFGDPKEFARMRSLLADARAPAGARRTALTSLLDARDQELAPLLQGVLDAPELRGQALRGLAMYEDPKTPGVILKMFAALPPAEKRDALNTLSARPAYASALLDAIAAKKVAAADVSADVVRQLRNLKNKDIDRRIGDVWGVVRDTPADRARQITTYRGKILGPGPQPDLALGRAVFAKTCQQCHVLFGVGGKVGPEITGANRADLNYLLENILDPSAVIPKEYAATVIEMKDGRVITAIVKEETPTALTVVTANETLTLPVREIAERTPSKLSMMPDDQLKPFSEREVRSLIAYLQSPKQTPVLATPENAKDFFNGKDLTGWDGDPKLWRVENGEIVGKSPGIKRNEFLKSQMVAEDFRLKIKVKLVPNKENSGIQFRSEALPDGEMKGPQADVGAGWWGKLYEESGRGLLSKKSGEEYVKVDDWNEYEILAVGSKVRTWINGKLCVDLDDAKISRRGIFGLQIHSGGPMEVRFRDFRLEVNPKW